MQSNGTTDKQRGWAKNFSMSWTVQSGRAVAFPKAYTEIEPGIRRGSEKAYVHERRCFAMTDS